MSELKARSMGLFDATAACSIHFSNWHLEAKGGSH